MLAAPKRRLVLRDHWREWTAQDKSAGAENCLVGPKAAGEACLWQVDVPCANLEHVWPTQGEKRVQGSRGRGFSSVVLRPCSTARVRSRRRGMQRVLTAESLREQVIDASAKLRDCFIRYDAQVGHP